MVDVLQLLRQLEWCAFHDFGNFGLHKCPICGGINNENLCMKVMTAKGHEDEEVTVQGGGHAPSCELAEALRELDPPKPSKKYIQRLKEVANMPGYMPPNDRYSASLECQKEVARKELDEIEARRKRLGFP